MAKKRAKNAAKNASGADDLADSTIALALANFEPGECEVVEVFDRP